MARFDSVSLEVINSKLISIIEEAATTLLRTCYSAIVRDSRDFTCTMTDSTGQLLAQAPHSLPAFAATMPYTVRECLKEYPIEKLEQGDVLITNNPWIAIGHLNDVVIITPIWFGGRVVAFAANAANVADIGGRGMGTQAASIYEEGIQIPILKLHEKGVPKVDIYRMIEQNVRMSDQVMGDIHAQVASNEVCSRRLVEFMKESNIDDFNELATAIQDRSEIAMRKAISAIPDGSYSHESITYGVEEEVKIKVTLTVKGDEIFADFTGTDAQSRWAINSVLNYTYAYTVYTIKCVIAPQIPNNEGCTRPIKINAPERTIVNPVYPAPVAARSQIGKFLPIPVMRALAKMIPEKVIADSGSAPLWCSSFKYSEPDGRHISHTPMMTGGMGARQDKDGISAIDFPSVIVNVPVEIQEHRFPLLIRRWCLVKDGGGPGQYRGGMGFEFEAENVSGTTMMASLRCERIENPAEGLEGGLPGSRGYVGRADGTILDPHKIHELAPNERIVFKTAGGGGVGEPRLRAPEAVLSDVLNGWVSVDAARDVYGVKIDPQTMQIDVEETAELRAVYA
ncbi:hydantoinase B/oxoprolinase family protein [Candidimonas nitroreducens]|uniref:Hydantoinase n=1 Tax=Candidimonas nitroreducens TaxID=683354 RepID=A0A225MWL7_9BURK|nr:hydantoinase B/oxoprolinase family protein [Candidimonas nitroreducens]OWT65787.1 hydantoinase [Candidimonas nitroreducens]